MKELRCETQVTRKRRREKCGTLGSRYSVKGSSYSASAVLCVKHKLAAEREGLTVTAVKARSEVA